MMAFIFGVVLLYLSGALKTTLLWRAGCLLSFRFFLFRFIFFQISGLGLLWDAGGSGPGEGHSCL